jgi:hypothetical protein
MVLALDILPLRFTYFRFLPFRFSVTSEFFFPNPSLSKKSNVHARELRTHAPFQRNENHYSCCGVRYELACKLNPASVIPAKHQFMRQKCQTVWQCCILTNFSISKVNKLQSQFLQRSHPDHTSFYGLSEKIEACEHSVYRYNAWPKSGNPLPQFFFQLPRRNYSLLQ